MLVLAQQPCMKESHASVFLGTTSSCDRFCCYLNGCQLEWVLILGREEQLTPKELMSYIAGGSVQDGSSQAETAGLHANFVCLFVCQGCVSSEPLQAWKASCRISFVERTAAMVIWSCSCFCVAIA